MKFPIKLLTIVALFAFVTTLKMSRREVTTQVKSISFQIVKKRDDDKTGWYRKIFQINGTEGEKIEITEDKGGHLKLTNGQFLLSDKNDVGEVIYQTNMQLGKHCSHPSKIFYSHACKVIIIEQKSELVFTFKHKCKPKLLITIGFENVEELNNFLRANETLRTKDKCILS